MGYQAYETKSISQTITQFWKTNLTIHTKKKHFAVKRMPWQWLLKKKERKTKLKWVVRTVRYVANRI